MSVVLSLAPLRGVAGDCFTDMQVSIALSPDDCTSQGLQGNHSATIPANS